MGTGGVLEICSDIYRGVGVEGKLNELFTGLHPQLCLDFSERWRQGGHAHGVGQNAFRLSSALPPRRVAAPLLVVLCHLRVHVSGCMLDSLTLCIMLPALLYVLSISAVLAAEA
jgi:hypothetical protein